MAFSPLVWDQTPGIRRMETGRMKWNYSGEKTGCNGSEEMGKLGGKNVSD